MSAFRAAVFLFLCLAVGAVHGAECPEDSVRDENGGCKCAQAECPPAECRPGQRPVQVRPPDPETPGSCCPRYNCVPSEGPEGCPEDSVLSEEGECKCIPCPAPRCRSGERPVLMRAATPETPGSCCPLYDCKPSESVSWAKWVSAEESELSGHCIHNGTARKIGERWQESDCVSCVCEKTGISCQAPMCKPCENAIPPDPGECCPHCPPPMVTNVSYSEAEIPCRTLDGCNLRCDHGYINDENNCPTCKCAERKKDEFAVAPPSPEDDRMCPELPHCGLNCDLVKDEGGCSVCACQPSDSFNDPANNTALIDSESGKKICPEVKCDLHCERGLVMDENDCTLCECKAPVAGCPPFPCRRWCPFGYKMNKRGCPICRCSASCTDHLNKTHPEGSTWYPNACTRCTCELGRRINCKVTVCSVACSNPLPPKPASCCPVCPITPEKGNETSHQSSRGWGTVPIMLIAILALLCLLLIIHIVRSRFRGRLSPSEANYSSYPSQYYKCVPAYDTPVHRNEKIVLL